MILGNEAEDSVCIFKMMRTKNNMKVVEFKIRWSLYVEFFCYKIFFAYTFEMSP